MIQIKRSKRGTWKKKFWLLPPVFVCMTGLYLLVLVITPALPSPQPLKNWNEPVSKKVEVTDQRLYIPRLSLNLKYGDTENSLNDGLWHRHPDRGNPEAGGNFILAGHRFSLAPTPSETYRKSPLYYADKLEVDDYLYADFNGKRYRYTITKKFEVKPTQIEIEAPSKEPKITLYTCTLGGENDGREVIEAKLSKVDIDPNKELELHESG